MWTTVAEIWMGLTVRQANAWSQSKRSPRDVNEDQWLGAISPRGGLDYLCSDGQSARVGLSLNRLKAGRRKLRLFLCACARRVWELIPAGPCRRAVELGERLAEGEDVAARVAALPDGPDDSDPLSRRHAGHAALACVETNIRWAAVVATQAAAMAAAWALEETEGGEKMQTYDRRETEEERAQAALLRDVFGNPFRTVAVEPQWHVHGQGAGAGHLRGWRLRAVADSGGCADGRQLRSTGPPRPLPQPRPPRSRLLGCRPAARQG